MPSSLIVVALVMAWLVVLVPMVVRKRQEIAKTADSTLAARVVRSGSGTDLDHDEAAQLHPDDDAQEDFTMRDTDVDADMDDDLDDLHEPGDDETDGEPRRYRPGRGGYDPEAAARAARAKYAFRQRVVVLMIIAAVVTAIVGAVAMSALWWAHAAIDVGLVGYLSYLRRQVRIEEEIRQRRLARMATPTRRASHARPAEDDYEDDDYQDETPVFVVP
ncbi:MAG: hypothetical protein M3443_08525, partial [Actinomycetota bacterium]|nr:hypothetical protein [Actinomycetota bacterium]